ncbi:MAG: hypothetical protein JNK14_14065 [Chitinophagaceae bacterium]|nr:hypothetical protein [Chitinophagaceae bacterium]
MPDLFRSNETAMATILNYPAWKKDDPAETGTADPHQVIERFFDFARLPEIKQMLRDVLETMINKNYAHPADSIQHDDMIYFFEKLEQLTEAAYRLHMRETAERSSDE